MSERDRLVLSIWNPLLAPWHRRGGDPIVVLPGAIGGSLLLSYGLVSPPPGLSYRKVQFVSTGAQSLVTHLLA